MRQRNAPTVINNFIPGTQLLKPTLDGVFKRLLLNNMDALKSLLTAVLQPKSPNVLRLDFIELPKISGLNLQENPLFSAWVKFLSAKSAKDLQSSSPKLPAKHS